MPAYFMIPCSCGRQLRADEKQVGLTLRCWGCGSAVVVPLPRYKGRLARELSNVTRDAFQSELVVKALAGGMVVTAALAVPRHGVALGVAAMVAAAWYYQDLFAVPRPPGRFASADAQGEAEDERSGTTLAPVWRLLLAVLSVAALLAPFVIRNGGLSLPENPAPAYARPLSALAFLGWLAVPVVLVAANARGRRGRVPAGRVFAGMSRHPLAALMALMMLPLGLVALESLLVVLLLEQNCLPLFVEDLFPTPDLELIKGTAGLMFRYDREVFHTPFDLESVPMLRTYARGLRHGFLLVSTIPASMPHGRLLRMSPDFFRMSDEFYKAMRAVFSVLILGSAGLILHLQARWLALVASAGEAPGAMEASPAASSIRPPVSASAPAPVAASAFAEAPRVMGVADSGSNSSPPPLALSVSPPPPFPLPSVSPFQIPGPVAYAPSGASAAVALAPAPTPSQAHTTPATTQRSGLPMILIVDDERPFATALGRVLADRGYAVHLANDAQDGLRLAAATLPDLIMLDLLLPDRSGLDVCRELRADAKTRSVPIVITTYKGDAADEVAGLEAGADDYIIKPYVLDVLLARIKKQLQRTRV